MRAVKKPHCFYGKVFFQSACRIILEPQKHVLHLVWSASDISTAFGVHFCPKKRPHMIYAVLSHFDFVLYRIPRGLSLLAKFQEFREMKIRRRSLRTQEQAIKC